MRASVEDVRVHAGAHHRASSSRSSIVFLRNLRATIIPGVAVPLSLIGTFGVMYLLGYSLDNLSLMALTISTGFVVDDAIVMIENIARYIEEGETPFEAALKGAKQIGFTIVSLTVSLVAVLIPLLFMGGSSGGCSASSRSRSRIAIGVSALLSLTLTPMMCARLLQPEHARASAGRFYRVERSAASTGCSQLYDRGLKWVLRHQPHDARWSTLATRRRSRCCSPSSCPRASSRSRTPGSSSASPRPRPTSRSRA